MEVHTGGVNRKQPDRNERDVERDRAGMHRRPRARTPRHPELVHEEEHGHGEEEHVARDVVPLPQPRHDGQPAVGHPQRRSEQGGVRLGGHRGVREAVLVRDGVRLAGRERGHAHAPRCCRQPVQEGGAEEPARECEPYGSLHAPFDESVCGALVRRAGEPEGEEGGGGPSPGAFDEVDVEDVGFVCKVVCRLQVVWKMCEEGVGGVEICIIHDGVDCSKEEGGCYCTKRCMTHLK